MANINNPFGLMPTMRTLEGGEAKIQTLKKASGYGTAIFIFDAVARANDGTIDKAITPGTTKYSGVSLTYGAASTETTHPVVVSPSAMFVAQTDGSLVEADLGLNANLVLTAGNTTTKISKHQIDSTTEATSGALDVHLYDRLKDPNNEFGNYCRFIIHFKNHRGANAVAGV